MALGHEMTDPGDGSRLLLTVLIAAWGAAFVYSFYAYVMTPPDGATGFLSGANRPAVFLGWQGIAGAFAIAVFGVSRRWPKGAAVRRMGVLPLVCAVAMVLGIIGVALWAQG